MKKIISFILIICIFLTLVSCAKVIDTETTVVEGTVIEAIYKARSVIPVFTGKITTLVTTPAKHIVKIQYNDIIISVNNSKLYEYYKEHIGEAIECNLITRYYDNGKIKTQLEVRGDDNA